MLSARYVFKIIYLIGLQQKIRLHLEIRYWKLQVWVFDGVIAEVRCKYLMECDDDSDETAIKHFIAKEAKLTSLMAVKSVQIHEKNSTKEELVKPDTLATHDGAMSDG